MMTPVELRDGRWYKRDDKYRHPSGVNGGKWRQCQWLVEHMEADVIVTGASILSPQHAMTAVAAAELGKRSLHVIGGTTVEMAMRLPSPRLAAEYGAHFQAIAVGYNPALQSRVRYVADAIAGDILHYGVTPFAANARTDPEIALQFHQLGARQTLNLPGGLRSLIVPFGSGNSAASILLGLVSMPVPPAEVHLVGIGPDRQDWLGRRLRTLGVTRHRSRIVFHRTGIQYGARVRGSWDGIELHPTYEAKVAKWIDEHPVPGWRERDGSACFWIVGGPLQ